MNQIFIKRRHQQSRCQLRICWEPEKCNFKYIKKQTLNRSAAFRKCMSYFNLSSYVLNVLIFSSLFCQASLFLQINCGTSYVIANVTNSSSLIRAAISNIRWCWWLDDADESLQHVGDLSAMTHARINLWNDLVHWVIQSSKLDFPFRKASHSSTSLFTFVGILFY